MVLFLLFGTCHSHNTCEAKINKVLCEGDSLPDLISHALEVNSNLTAISIDYTGKPANITSAAFHRVQSKLLDLEISGSVISIEEKSFALATNLRRFSIKDSLITKLPMELFPKNSKLENISLSDNRLTDIPLHLFNSTKSLKILNIARNCIIRKVCSLGYEFQELKNLTELNLSGLSIDRNACRRNKPKHGIFAHISQNLRHLSLANTSHIVDKKNAGYKTLFPHLESLDLSGFRELTYCPGAGLRELFQDLPVNITSLKLRLLRTVYDISRRPECFLDASDFDALRSMPHLRFLDFGQSDLIFGQSIITPDFFNGFLKLDWLDLSYTRISLVTKHAFDGLPNLTTLKLDGNPLSSRMTDLQRSGNATIKSLSMRGCGIASDESLISIPLTFLFRNKIAEIDVSGNLLRYNPLFFLQELKASRISTIYYRDHKCQSQEKSLITSVTSNTTPQLNSIAMNDNFITKFREVFGGTNSTDYCSQLPNLRNISMVRNHLVDIRGICETVKNLWLSDNNVGSAWDLNSHFIKSLDNLEILDLSRNNISYIASDDMLKAMTNLKELNLFYNYIESFPNGFFGNNKRLEILNIANNRIIHFDHSLLTNYASLSHVYFHDNRIGKFDEDLLKKLELSPKIVLSFDGNPVKCDCSELFLKKWLKTDKPEHVYVKNIPKILCDGGNGIQVIQYKSDSMDCYGYEIIKYAGIALACICFTLLVALPCYKYRWFLKHPKIVLSTIIRGLKAVRLDFECEYDAYIAYDHDSEADCNFMVKKLLPALDKIKDGTEDVS